MTRSHDKSCSQITKAHLTSNHHLRSTSMNKRQKSAFSLALAIFCLLLFSLMAEAARSSMLSSEEEPPFQRRTRQKGKPTCSATFGVQQPQSSQQQTEKCSGLSPPFNALKYLSDEQLKNDDVASSPIAIFSTRSFPSHRAASLSPLGGSDPLLRPSFTRSINSAKKGKKRKYYFETDNESDEDGKRQRQMHVQHAPPLSLPRMKKVPRSRGMQRKAKLQGKDAEKVSDPDDLNKFGYDEIRNAREFFNKVEARKHHTNGRRMTSEKERKDLGIQGRKEYLRLCHLDNFHRRQAKLKKEAPEGQPPRNSVVARLNVKVHRLEHGQSFRTWKPKDQRELLAITADGGRNVGLMERVSNLKAQNKATKKEQKNQRKRSSNSRKKGRMNQGNN